MKWGRLSYSCWEIYQAFLVLIHILYILPVPHLVFPTDKCTAVPNYYYSKLLLMMSNKASKYIVVFFDSISTNMFSTIIRYQNSLAIFFRVVIIFVWQEPVLYLGSAFHIEAVANLLQTSSCSVNVPCLARVKSIHGYLKIFTFIFSLTSSSNGVVPH